MPTRKIDMPRSVARTNGYSAQETCRDPDHAPADMMAWPEGVYEHTCRRCGHTRVFLVERGVWTGGGG
jgi:hypothetical protein